MRTYREWANGAGGRAARANERADGRKRVPSCVKLTRVQRQRFPSSKIDKVNRHKELDHASKRAALATVGEKGAGACL